METNNEHTTQSWSHPALVHTVLQNENTANDKKYDAQCTGLYLRKFNCGDSKIFSFLTPAPLCSVPFHLSSIRVVSVLSSWKLFADNYVSFGIEEHLFLTAYAEAAMINHRDQLFQ